MLQHSFVLDALETTASDTFSHFEMLIEEHRALELEQMGAGTLSLSGHHHQRSLSSILPMHQQSRLRQLVPTIGSFHTDLPLREAFEAYNEKHKLTQRKHITISFNEIRHILNLAQIMALRKNFRGPEWDEEGDKVGGTSPLNNPNAAAVDAMSHTTSADDLELERALPRGRLRGPRMITFDGDQTLYSDGANFESNPRLAFYLYQLLRHGVVVAVVTAAGYEYNVEKYEYRLSGLLQYFRQRGLTEEECGRFYLFGGECNYLVQLGKDFALHPVKESGPGGWYTSTRHLGECPGNWSESEVKDLLDVSEASWRNALDDLNLRGRVIRKRRAVGLIPLDGREITRESLDEVVLRVHEELHQMNGGIGPSLPYCAFNGGTDAWVDVGNKRVGVQVLQAYLGIEAAETLHIGDQFLNTGNDYAARAVSPCIWIINPQETTYILKSILRLAGVQVALPEEKTGNKESDDDDDDSGRMDDPASLNRTVSAGSGSIDFKEIERRRQSVKAFDVYTGEVLNQATGS